MIAFFSLVSLRGVLVAPPKVTQVRVKKIFDREFAMLLRGPPSQFCHCGHFFVITKFQLAVSAKIHFQPCLLYYSHLGTDRQTFFIFKGVYSRVTSALPWINQHFKKLE